METVTSKQIAEVTRKSIRYINMRANKDGWPFEAINKRGDRRYYINRLPVEIQKALAASGDISIKSLPLLAPEAALILAEKVTYPCTPSRRGQKVGGQGSDTEGILPSIYNIGIAKNMPNTWSDETAIDMTVIRDPRVAKWARIIQEAMKPAKGWKKRDWITDVARRNDTTLSTIYRQIEKYNKKGLAGLKHTKGPKQTPRTWTSDAIDYWIGLIIKKEHRKIHKDALYSVLCVEADRRGWQIGTYESALWWARQRVTPQLLALQRGGVRALDNTLPPVVRDYSDLAPFEILVGDQHRFDFWVTDEESGEIFRPEGYFWVDLRTRCFYGGSIDRKYDSYLMGLALRMGLKIFGPFESIYTDNGKPEESKYIIGIVKDMRAIGLDARQTVDVHIDDTEDDPELVNPMAGIAGTHRKAIVRNAKAKMIEGTFNVFEGILRDHFFVPGYVKKLGGSQDENEVDQKEIEALAKAGKLLTFREFCLTVLKAMDYYNRVKAHKGTLKEWVWRPKPKTATPMDCLQKCCDDGWKPVMLSDEAIDLVFLPRATRIVDRGRIMFQHELYGDDKLIGLHGQRVEIRFDPLDPEWLLVFKDHEYLARALPVEYSSMKDLTLAQRKIQEKRRQHKGFILEYRTLTHNIPDVREFSQVPKIEKVAAVIGQEKRKQITERAELNRVMTDEELATEVAKAEARGQRSEVRKKKLPARPNFFLSALDRYKWIVKFELAEGELDEADAEFKTDYEGRMDEAQREHWAVVREMGYGR